MGGAVIVVIGPFDVVVGILALTVIVLSVGVAQGPQPGHFLLAVTVTGQSKDLWGEGSSLAITSCGSSAGTGQPSGHRIGGHGIA